jgi:hypothetical protein
MVPYPSSTNGRIYMGQHYFACRYAAARLVPLIIAFACVGEPAPAVPLRISDLKESFLPTSCEMAAPPLLELQRADTLPFGTVPLSAVQLQHGHVAFTNAALQSVEILTPDGVRSIAQTIGRGGSALGRTSSAETFLWVADGQAWRGDAVGVEPQPIDATSSSREVLGVVETANVRWLVEKDLQSRNHYLSGVSLLDSRRHIIGPSPPVVASHGPNEGVLVLTINHPHTVVAISPQTEVWWKFDFAALESAAVAPPRSARAVRAVYLSCNWIAVVFSELTTSRRWIVFLDMSSRFPARIDRYDLPFALMDALPSRSAIGVLDGGGVYIVLHYAVVPEQFTESEAP